MIGIYGIFRKSDDKCVYVGESKDITGRIKAHFIGKNARFNKEEYYGEMIEQHFINDKQYRLDREAYWINELNSECNKMRDRHNSEEQKKKQSERMTGENNPMYGKNPEDFMTPEAIKERRKKISAARKGKHHSKESKKKQSEVKKGENNPSYGKKWINNGEITKYVKQEELYKYIQDGWKLGRLAWKRNS